MNIINRFTLQTLKKNKVRTAVTIIGILLSTAMFTAVTSIIVSMQQYMVDMEIDYSGAWHGRINNLSKENALIFQKNDNITSSTLIQNIGYAKLEGGINENKPYLCIESISSNFTNLSPIKLTEGRMPKNSNELVISEHLSDNGNITYKIGDTLTINVGKREAGEGIILGQNNAYDKESEKIKNTVSKTYKVVGICERPTFENFSAPGYTAFTTGENKDAYSYDVLFQIKDPTTIDTFLNKFIKKLPSEQLGVADSSVHSDLLRFTGQSPNGNYMNVLEGMGAILMGIIMAASISLIYNAFSISISERTKQFGLLKSIGATKKQIRKSVLFEAFSLCLIGIPLGVGCGLLGIGITLHFVGKLMTDTGMIAISTSVQLKLCISWWSIVTAIIIAIVTVIISAMLPARRAVKIPAIEALRESNEIKLRQKNVRSSKLVYKIFGFEGMLADKNFKRNRRKHRMTVISLALSVILFVSTSCFSNYMMSSTNILEDNSVYDISFSVTAKELGKNDVSTTKLRLKQEKNVDDVAYSKSVEGLTQIDTDNLTPDYLKFLKNYLPDSFDDSGKKVLINTKLYYVDETIYKKYLEEHKLDVSHFMDSQNLCPLIWDTVSGITEKNTISTTNMLADTGFTGDLYYINSTDDLYFNGEILDAAKMTLSFTEVTEDATTNKKMPKEKALKKITLKDSKVMTEKLPLGVIDTQWENVLTIVFPYSAIGMLPDNLLNLSSTNFQIQAKNHKQATTALENFFKNESGYSTSVASRVYDKRASEEVSIALVSIINIFSYGFITLITLIVIANVFNTISTNIQLRRKEFAMLKSVGMTKKGFDHMMNYECILYGVKGLLFGLPVSFVLCYLMYRSLRSGLETSFMIPWLSVVIVVISVFVIVFASMLYSMNKIKKDNPIEALRNDNL